tara:strand:+ start:5827 stop:6303 length:477 start_codon:yes stop_codon:yes gene_type:complete
MKTVTIKQIADHVIEFTGLDIRNKRRRKDLVTARVLYTYLCINSTNITTTAIGEEINRHHATILHYKGLLGNPYYLNENLNDLQSDCLEVLRDRYKDLDIRVDKVKTIKSNPAIEYYKKQNDQYKIKIKGLQTKCEMLSVRCEDLEKVIYNKRKLQLR